MRKKNEFEQSGDYAMMTVYAKLEGERELTPLELQDVDLVREKVRSLFGSPCSLLMSSVRALLTSTASCP